MLGERAGRTGQERTVRGNEVGRVVRKQIRAQQAATAGFGSIGMQ